MERSEGDMSLNSTVTPPGIDPGTVRLLAQRLNRYATPEAHLCVVLKFGLF
jgi:hypothetical protein